MYTDSTTAAFREAVRRVLHDSPAVRDEFNGHEIDELITAILTDYDGTYSALEATGRIDLGSMVLLAEEIAAALDEVAERL